MPWPTDAGRLMPRLLPGGEGGKEGMCGGMCGGICGGMCGGIWAMNGLGVWRALKPLLPSLRLGGAPLGSGGAPLGVLCVPAAAARWSVVDAWSGPSSATRAAICCSVDWVSAADWPPQPSVSRVMTCFSNVS